MFCLASSGNLYCIGDKAMNRRVVVTRPVGAFSGGRTLTVSLEERGYQVFELPLLRSVSLPLSEEGHGKVIAESAAVKDLWLVFLSPTAVWVWKKLVGDDAALLNATSRALIAVQGSGTANAVRECFARKVDFVPTVFVAEEFAREFAQRVPKMVRVVVLQSADGRDVFAPTLASLGFSALSINTYQLQPEPVAAETLDKYREFVSDETVIIFMSPSAVRAAAGVLGPSLGTDKVLSVGPITSQALRVAGFPVWREAQEHSEAGVVASLESGWTT
jgi:uroporphyrinogen-III synthase